MTNYVALGHSNHHRELLDQCDEQLHDDTRRLLLQRLWTVIDQQFDNVEIVNGQTLEQ